MPISSPEDCINEALVEIAYPQRIGDIYEGSPAANAALEIYSQTRDEILGAGEWPFARRANVTLALLKGPPPPGGYSAAAPWAPTYPPPNWAYEYAYPSDMIDLRSVYIARPIPNFAPRAALWRVDNDNSGVDAADAPMTQQKVILSNLAGAMATYIGRVTNPLLWPPDFTALLIKRLAEKLARQLGAGDQVAHDEVALEGASAQVAARVRGG